MGVVVQVRDGSAMREVSLTPTLPPPEPLSHGGGLAAPHVTVPLMWCACTTAGTRASSTEKPSVAQCRNFSIRSKTNR